MSASQVSRIREPLDDAVADLRDREPPEDSFPYIWVDATYVKCREGDHVSSCNSAPVLLMRRPPIRLHGQSGREKAAAWWPNARSALPSSRRGLTPYHAHGGTYAEIARELGYNAGSVSDWMERESGGSLSAAGNALQAEKGLARLTRENDRLRKEEEALLKASPFFASEEL